MPNDKYMSRNIDAQLLDWSRESKRKPLLIRGARQVGKSSAIRKLAERFEYFVEVNFETDTEARELFAYGNLWPERLCPALELMYKTPIKPGKTLLFLDEIQASLPAISSLRSFYERSRDLHVVAAGSLLEFALRELPSFGVGRIRCMFMYPMNFAEFLNACGYGTLRSAIQQASSEKPLDEVIHNKVVDLLKSYFIVGGMPEVVSAYVTQNDFLACQRILDDLVINLRSDFAKYKDKGSTQMISAVFESVMAQTGQKFVYTNVRGEYHHRQLKEALELLKMAGLVIPVTHTAASGIPLGAGINIKKQKMLPLDTGIFLRVLDLPLADFLIGRDFSLINKGNIAELFAGLEIQKSYSCYEQNDLYYWHREGKNSNAEIDYIIQKGRDIIPIEVKSNTSGSMQSMRVFQSEKSPPFGIRASLENFGEMSDIKIVPLYAIGDFVARGREI